MFCVLHNMLNGMETIQTGGNGLKEMVVAEDEVV